MQYIKLTELKKLDKNPKNIKILILKNIKK